MSRKPKKNKSSFADKFWRFLSVVAGFGVIIWLGWIVFDAIRFSSATECEANQTVNCYKFENAKITKIDDYSNKFRRPHFSLYLQTDSKKFYTSIKDLEFGESLRVNDYLRIKIWENNVINIEKDGEIYATNDNPQIDISNMYFHDLLIWIVLFSTPLIIFLVIYLAHLRRKSN
jgi:hypothetical protein